MFLGGTVLTAFELRRRDMRDVLGAVGLFLLGLMLGIVAQILFPGGALLGGLGGAALGKTRFDEIRRSRIQALTEEFEGVEKVSERQLLLFNALERSRPESSAARRFLGKAVVFSLSVVSVVLLSTGLLLGVSSWILMGGLAAALPASAWASHTVRTDEQEFLDRTMILWEDEGTGVLGE